MGISGEQIERLIQRYYGVSLRELERDLRKIAAPYLELIDSIYLYSGSSTLLCTQGKFSLIHPVTYPPKIEAQVKEVRQEMAEALAYYVKQRRLPFQT